jgi:hypothetical protein
LKALKEESWRRNSTKEINEAKTTKRRCKGEDTDDSCEEPTESVEEDLEEDTAGPPNHGTYWARQAKTSGRPDVIRLGEYIRRLVAT